MKIRALRIGLLVTAIIIALIAVGDPSRLWLGRFDFRAFYCAAQVLSSGTDPYRYGPLHSCEVPLAQLPPNAVVPAPLPPYAIAAFVPLSKLPFDRADLLWLLVIIAAAVAFALAIVDLTGLPVWLVGVCTVSVLLVEPLMNGALPPLPLGLLCAGAAALARGRWTLAAILIALAAVQPHLALPPMAAAFLLVPQMRVRLAIAAATIAAISLAVGGWQLNLEYLLAVLPAHAASELGMYGQYSLSSVLYTLGVPERAALLAGSAQYAIFVAIGILVARRLHAVVPGGVVLIPLAYALTGGTFVHQTEIAGALPLAFALASRMGTRLSWAGVWLLATPWEWVVGANLGLVAGVVAACVLLYRRVRWPIAALLGAALATALGLYSFLVHLRVVVLPIPPTPANDLADSAWTLWEKSFPWNSYWLPAHALTYLGLVTVYWSILLLLRRPSDLSTAARTEPAAT